MFNNFGEAKKASSVVKNHFLVKKKIKNKNKNAKKST